MLTRRKKILEVSKPRLLMLGFTFMFNVTLAGLVCGTFAWYTYATRASLSPYRGTTVANMGELQIGLVCNTRLLQPRKYGLQPHNSEDNPIANGKFIYWSTSDSLDAKAINYVVNTNGYATTTIEPTTSASNDAVNSYGFHLYKKPTVFQNYSTTPHYYAEKSSYVLIPFVFRIAGSSDIEEDEDFGNVYLSNCTLFTSNDAFDDGELHKAVRFYVKHKRGSYIVAPSYSGDGETEVGGILDLDLNGFYDYGEDKKEIVYGEHEGDFSYLSDPTPTDGTLTNQEITSFYSNHKQDVYAVDETTLVPKTVSYYGLSRLTSREFPIAVSDAYYEGYSYGELMVYLEGWDKHVIDQEQESAFNLDLSFTF